MAQSSNFDQMEDLKAVIVSYLSEHCLSLSLAPSLVELAQRLAQDRNNLDKLSLSRQTATHYLTHGVAKTMKDELAEKLKHCFFSLNVDEATNNTDDKVLNMSGILMRTWDKS